MSIPWKFFAVHGSQISLMSGASSMYGSTTEEQRQANEVRRLKRELTEAREQCLSLSSQLSTNVSTYLNYMLTFKEEMHKICHVSNLKNSKESIVQYLNNSNAICLRKKNHETSKSNFA